MNNNLKRHAAVWLLLMLTAVSAVVHGESQIVNIDAKYNSHSNPQYLYLPAGEYAIEYIGPQQGGRHTARNAWRGITMWCNDGSQLCELGWEISLMIGGEHIEIPAKNRVTRWGANFYACKPADFSAMKPPEALSLAFASPETALHYIRKAQETSELCKFKVARPGFISLMDGDKNATDNHGGTSIRVLTTLAKQTFLVDVQPETHNNVVEVTRAGTLQVTIFGGDGRHVSTIRPETLSLLPDASPLNIKPSAVCKQTEANDDSHPDLVCSFATEPSEIGPGATRVYLAGLTTDGALIDGWDVLTLR